MNICLASGSAKSTEHSFLTQSEGREPAVGEGYGEKIVSMSLP